MTLRALYKQQTETHPQSSCEKGLFSCQELQPEDQASVCHTSRGYKMCSQGPWAEKHSISTLPWPHQSSPIPPTKQLIHTSKAIIFAAVTQRTLLDLLVWSRQGLWFRYSRLYICTYFESFCLRIWLIISLKLGIDWDFSLWSPNRFLAHPQNLGPIKDKTGYLDNHKILRSNQKRGRGWIKFISYTKSLLQDWERCLFHLIHINKQKKSKWGGRRICSKLKTKLQKRTKWNRDGNLPDKEFKVLVIKMPTGLQRKSDEPCETSTNRIQKKNKSTKECKNKNVKYARGNHYQIRGGRRTDQHLENRV